MGRAPEAVFKVGESTQEIACNYFGQVLGLMVHMERDQIRKCGLPIPGAVAAGLKYHGRDRQRDLVVLIDEFVQHDQDTARWITGIRASLGS